MSPNWNLHKSQQQLKTESWWLHRHTVTIMEDSFGSRTSLVKLNSMFGGQRIARLLYMVKGFKKISLVTAPHKVFEY